MTCKGLFLSLLLGCLLLEATHAQTPSTFRIGGLFEFTVTDTDTGETSVATEDLQTIYSGFLLAISDINASPDILPDTVLETVIYDTEGTVSGALSGLVEADATGLSVVIGPSFSDQSLIAAVASGVYDILLASPSSSAAALSDDSLYPLFVRSIPPDTQQSTIMVDLVEYYFNQTGVEAWRSIGVISTADDYGVGGARDFIDIAASRNFTTAAFQQFLVGATDVSVEVREIGNSGARVFISFMQGEGYQTMIREANKQGLVGKFYVWICSDGCATAEAFEDEDSEVEENYEKLSVGYQGTLPRGGNGDAYEEYLERFLNLDPSDFPGAGATPTLFNLLSYEITTAVALALDAQFKAGNFTPTGTDLYDTILGLEFTTLTGDFLFESNGDRQSAFEVTNLRPSGDFQTVFEWDVTNGLVQVAETVFRSGSTRIPDLDVDPEFDFWSCDDKESGTDETGKTINRRVPDGDDVNFIRASYECDQFIDCQNMSDEGYQCTPSFIVAFIVIGILTGLLVLCTIWCLPLVCIFGFCVRRHRIFLSGTVFLIIMIIACVVGFISTYAWYGKPHTVACNFQLWLFGLSSAALVAALFAKQLRFFRSTTGTNFARKITKSDEKGASNPINPEVEFLIMWALLMIFPLLMIILWTAISTPQADLVEVDDLDHYICTSRGVTGSVGGLVFFFLLVGYNGILLFLSLFLGFLVRHVPKPFMDKRLMSISVFNLGFLTAVVVPVFLVLRFISPFAAWIVRTLGILYGFSSTLFIHMIPKIVGLLIDRFQPNAGDGKGPTPTRRGNATMGDTASMSASQSTG